jgi:hypothetical protein
MTLRKGRASALPGTAIKNIQGLDSVGVRIRYSSLTVDHLSISACQENDLQKVDAHGRATLS